MNSVSRKMTAAEELLESVSVPFEKAHAMPKSVYTSEEFLKHEIEDVFGQEWFCVAVPRPWINQVTTELWSWRANPSWLYVARMVN